MKYRGGLDSNNEWVMSALDWALYLESHPWDRVNFVAFSEERTRFEEQQRMAQEAIWAERDRQRQIAFARRTDVNEKTQATLERNVAKRAAGWARFPTRKIRRLWVYTERLSGRTFKSIGEEIGVSVSRASELFRRAEREMRRKLYHPPVRERELGRPLDMGGPRDVWLEFYVPPDPRFDNMAPVGIEN